MPKVKKDITFGMFWKKYPLHLARKDAERAWNRLSAKDKMDAYNAIDSYYENCKKTGVSLKYAQGWLNGRRWEDEIPDGETPKNVPVAEEKHGTPIEMELW